MRATGSFTVSPAAREPHGEGEGAGVAAAVVIYNTRGSDNGVVFAVLDDNQKMVGALTFDDLKNLFAAQGNRPGA